MKEVSEWLEISVYGLNFCSIAATSLLSTNQLNFNMSNCELITNIIPHDNKESEFEFEEKL